MTDTPTTKDNSLAAHLIKKGFALLVLIAAAIGGWLYLGHADHAPEALTGQRPAGPPPEVPVQTLTATDIPYSPTVLGQAEAFRIVQIRSRVAGFLDQQKFKEGQIVEKGQPLFTIDPRSFEADVEVAKANLESAQATQSRAEAQLRRYEALAKSNAATPSELEEWQTEAGVARANVALAQARLEQAMLDLSYTEVSSPIPGYVGMTNKDVGSYVDSSTNSLLTTVRQIDPIYVRYNISEHDILNWQRMAQAGDIDVDNPDQLEVQLTLSDGTAYPHTGVINFVDIVIDPNDGTAEIRAEVPNPDNQLRPGQFVQISLQGVRRHNVLLVPQRAVMQNPTGASVYVLDEANHAQQRMIQLGEWQGENWVVSGGLQPGDRIVADGTAKVRPGSEVVATSTQAASTQ